MMTLFVNYTFLPDEFEADVVQAIELSFSGITYNPLRWKVRYIVIHKIIIVK